VKRNVTVPEGSSGRTVARIIRLAPLAV
jgi:hypothetical protein